MKFMMRRAKNGDLWLYFDPEFYGGEEGFACKIEDGVWYPQGMVCGDSELAASIRKLPVVECVLGEDAGKAVQEFKDAFLSGIKEFADSYGKPKPDSDPWADYETPCD